MTMNTPTPTPALKIPPITWQLLSDRRRIITETMLSFFIRLHRSGLMVYTTIHYIRKSMPVFKYFV